MNEPISQETFTDLLARPEPQGPSFNEIMQLADDFFVFRGNSHGDSFFATEITAKTDPAQALEKFAQAVLQRWGRLSEDNLDDG
jgi:hypothetical protein